MSKTVGYLEGTDSSWLTELQLLGHDTIPLANGADGHGLPFMQLSPRHYVDVVVGYLHKIIPPRGEELTGQDMLRSTKVYEIPVLIACPVAKHPLALHLLGVLPANVRLVDPSEMLAEILRAVR